MTNGNVRVVKWMHIFNNVETRIWRREYTFLITQGYGHDKSVPYAWRNVRATFRGCSQRYRKPSAAFWQTVSSRRGRFIVPAYMKTPTKWQTKMCVWWNEYTYLIMWKHVIDNVDMRVRWNGNTYLMTWIYVFDNVRIRARWIGPYAWRNVRNQFRGCSQRYRNPFAAFWQTVRSCRGRFIAPAYT